MSEDRCLARLLRFAVVSRLYADGRLDLPGAQEILAGPLTPGDASTIVDDSQLMNMPYEAALDFIREAEKGGEE